MEARTEWTDQRLDDFAESLKILPVEVGKIREAVDRLTHETRAMRSDLSSSQRPTADRPNWVGAGCGTTDGTRRARHRRGLSRLHRRRPVTDQRLKRLGGHRLALEEGLRDRIQRRARVEQHLAGAIVGFVDQPSDLDADQPGFLV